MRVAGPTTRARRATWMHSALFDACLALAWVPFAAAAVLLRHDVEALSTYSGIVLVAALAHQPITLALVYGDSLRRAERPNLFRWSPPILIAAIVIGALVSVELVLLVALLWNLEHHVMQRYGIGRIFGRLGGDTTGGSERLMHWIWGGTMLLWVLVDPGTPTWIQEVHIGSANRAGLETLLHVRPVAVALIVPAVLASLVMAVRWVRRERTLGPDANPAKWLYLSSTFVLLATFAVMPIAGVVGLAASHAIEYFVVVTDDVERRYVKRSPDTPSPLSRLVGWGGRAAFLGFVAGSLFLLYLGVRAVVTPRAFLFVLAAIGALHVWYDGFIWRSPRPR